MRKKAKKTIGFKIINERVAKLKEALNNGNFIPILDRDPIQAARSLVFSHVKNAIDAITISLVYIRLKQKDKMKFIQDKFIRENLFADVFRTTGNILFYSKMYEELQDIHFKATGEYRRTIPEFKTEFLYETESPLFHVRHFPLTIRHIEKFMPYNDFYRKRYKEYLYKRYNVINCYRRIYLHEGYTLDKFPVGAPRWYSPSRVIIYQKYDMLSRKSIRITTDVNGHYRYFMAYITDKWTEIENVPEEMRDVIDSILMERNA